MVACLKLGGGVAILDSDLEVSQVGVDLALELISAVESQSSKLLSLAEQQLEDHKLLLANNPNPKCKRISLRTMDFSFKKMLPRVVNSIEEMRNLEQLVLPTVVIDPFHPKEIVLV